MGLFKKESCALCGQPKGLLGPKLADGSCLCLKCAETGNEQIYGNIKDFPRKGWRETTLEEFKQDQALLVEHGKKLAEFEPTIHYCDIVHIDEDSYEMVITRGSDLESLKKEPEKAGVMVHKVHDIVFERILYRLEKIKEGILNDYVIADIILLIAFDEPFARLYAVTLKSKAKLRISGTFNKTYEPDEECTKLANYLDRFFPQFLSNEGRLWEAVACAKRENYLDSDDVSYLLKEFHWGDKPKMKEIRRQYGL